VKKLEPKINSVCPLLKVCET